MSDADWGDVPGWIEAISTFGALVVTAFALRYVVKTWRATKVQLENADRQLELARRAAHSAHEAAQSAEMQVNAALDQSKVSYEMLGIEKRRDQAREDAEAEVRSAREAAVARAQADQVAAWVTRSPFASGPPPQIRVVNQSSQPVFQFRMWFQAGDRVITRPNHRQTLSQWMLAPSAAPGIQPFETGFNPNELAAVEAAEKRGEPFGLCFSFRDIHSQEWTRLWNGELIPGRHEPAE
ncbi:hypothetical protein [Kineosporia babensis]|uniref:Uncharacterized protein n=1 Tax=Kineosporia babensis TaxID=499548 RepID=A0A9X1NNX9_9ACTN|nr:hypothetical protein [Kineosporia babensis]MCD5317234.1 hypothetical protein [Kineosporia babensis]